MESRIWIVDNSFEMNTRDCSLLLADDRLSFITRKDGARRWDEQLQCVAFHMKMAARAWIPTKVSLKYTEHWINQVYTSLSHTCVSF